MSAQDETVAGLKQILITASNTGTCYGDHLARHLVDWFQFGEHQLYKKQQQQQQSDSSQHIPDTTLKTASPVDILLASTAVIPRLVEQGKADEILDTLRTYSQLPYVDKEVLVLCLAVTAKQTEQKKLVTDAHSAVRELCTNTHLFFLFIQFSKMIAKKDGHCGWGRGLRRAVGSWYLSWEPHRLAVEVTRHASAHGWTHRDVIKLAHLKLKDMPIGTQVVLHYVFQGLGRTTEKYSGQDNSQDLLTLLQALDKDGHPQEGEKAWDVDEVISKVTKLHEKFGNLTLDDVPSQSLKSQELWSHLLDKLDSESLVASVNRLGRCHLLNPSTETLHPLQDQLVARLTQETVAAGPISPTQTLLSLHAYQHPARFIVDLAVKSGRGGARGAGRVLARKSSKVNPKVIEAMHTLIANSAKNIDKTKGKLGVCIDVRGSMATTHVWTGNPEGKGEVTCQEAAAVTALSLSSGGTNTAVSTLAFSESGLVNLTLGEGATLSQVINVFKETVIGGVNVNAALEWGKENGAETLVVLTHRLDHQAVAVASQALDQFNHEHNTQLRLVLCGLGTKRLNTPHIPGILLMLGFHHRTPTIIRAFHERYF
ncbi:hypothetical protein Pcinc_014468 [Petrolisthes cinctipes]|uniref:TROVE domain-containing protein n=1 Tax=Petrolisthes cinctipes TaxID=88211 RepID=A0AAE1FWX5_PETCI|nr:hypothetical protein Pcinc_014468 [Petrolisthes cinctipes]